MKNKKTLLQDIYQNRSQNDNQVAVDVKHANIEAHHIEYSEMENKDKHGCGTDGNALQSRKTEHR